ncbi:uncharacterized protein LOC143262236 isoform X3 [Megalopta genalis]|uniref:uncharacterized protein LOC143262236 isoform X3 n=2 Tax=Megalopta genalis TaxID=115081 RepID=UPI003FD2AA63
MNNKVIKRLTITAEVVFARALARLFNSNGPFQCLLQVKSATNKFRDSDHTSVVSILEFNRFMNNKVIKGLTITAEVVFARALARLFNSNGPFQCLLQVKSATNKFRDSDHTSVVSILEFNRLMNNKVIKGLTITAEVVFARALARLFNSNGPFQCLLQVKRPAINTAISLYF